MKIDELDESQGLTADMVREWLMRHHWECKPAQDLNGQSCWVLENGKKGTIWLPEARPDGCVKKLAAWMEESMQALLREINPRMRDGWPSDAALQVHQHWMVQPFDDDGFCVIWDVPTVRERRGHAPNAQLRFWPCDEHGNKVRWPTDAEGNML